MAKKRPGPNLQEFLRRRHGGPFDEYWKRPIPDARRNELLKQLGLERKRNWRTMYGFFASAPKEALARFAGGRNAKRIDAKIEKAMQDISVIAENIESKHRLERHGLNQYQKELRKRANSLIIGERELRLAMLELEKANALLQAYEKLGLGKQNSKSYDLLEKGVEKWGNQIIKEKERLLKELNSTMSSKKHSKEHKEEFRKYLADFKLGIEKSNYRWQIRTRGFID